MWNCQPPPNGNRKGVLIDGSLSLAGPAEHTRSKALGLERHDFFVHSGSSASHRYNRQAVF
jgi:hypothetical protein